MPKVAPISILPSQNFLKENTVRFIFDCLANNRIDELPPTPLVRKNKHGDLVAIDGHNLIAVRLFRDEMIDVVIADSASEGLPPTSEANRTRNQELAEKFDVVLKERQKVETEGILTFQDLIRKYPHLFDAK